MQSTYENFGIRFLYPEDWSIDEEEQAEWPRRVSVQSPESGYWELQLYPGEYGADDLSEQVLAAFREEYEDVDAEAVSDEIRDVAIVGFDLDFFCLDFLVSCGVRSFSLADHTVLLIFQAEANEFQRRRQVFNAMTQSLEATSIP